ncbi:MAG: EcsC family protein [Cyanobacteriota bacterium]
MAKKKYGLTRKVASGIVGSIEKSGKVIGGILDYITASNLYRIITEKLGIHWFFEKILNVDVFKVQRQVEKFRQKYPDDPPHKLAERLTKHKAFYTASIGFTSGLIPANIPALIFDFITSTAAQAELIYEIAMVYGLDLEDTTRKGEVLTLIALGAGSSKTAEATLRLAVDISSRKFGQVMTEKMLKAFSIVVGEKIAKKSLSKLIPVLGGLIGASINASVIMLTGKGAIAFYQQTSQRNLLYDGKLPDELKNIFSKSAINENNDFNLRALIVVKTVIFLLNKANYSEESIYKTIEQFFAELLIDLDTRELILQEIKQPTYNDFLIEKMDKETVSLIISKAIMCINNLGNLNDFHKKYLKALSIKFELPFEDFETV